MAEAWSMLKSAARQLGFSYVELTLHLVDGSDDATRASPLRASGSCLDPARHSTRKRLSPWRWPAEEAAPARSSSAAPRPRRPCIPSCRFSSTPLQSTCLASSSDTSRPAWLAPPLPETPAAGEAVEWTRPDTTACKSCGSSRLYRLRSRSILEQTRKKLTARRLYECGFCGWRGWALQSTGAPKQPASAVNPSAPDLGRSIWRFVTSGPCSSKDTRLRRIAPFNPERVRT